LNQINCRFCQVSDVISNGTIDNFWNRPLLETDNFFVVPSLGAMVEGWLLIVTKEHHLCMGALKPKQITELNELSLYIKSIVESCYGKVAIFEHGPALEKLAVGCGVDHAHLHIVPTTVPLVEQSNSWNDQPFDWVKVPGIIGATEHYLKQQSYLYVDQEISGALLYAGDGITSQFFRKTIASHLNILSEFNWRDNPNFSNIKKTVECLEPRLHHISSNIVAEYGGQISGRTYRSSIFETVG
jgi:ATP adenylyltransferase